MPQAWQLRLSDAFGDRRGAMELIVEVLNINETAGNDILARCAPLKAYSAFVAKVRQIVAAGNLLREAIPEAMRYCIDNGYLEEYFTAKQETEVFDMVNFQWDADLALEVRTEEAREEAMAQGLAEGMEKGMAQGMEPAIRGLGFNRIAVSENGIKQEGQQWGSDHGLEIDAFNVEEVRVRKGPSSLIFGSDAIGGVIEILPAAWPAADQLFGEAVMLGKSLNGTLGGSLMLGLCKGVWLVRARINLPLSGK